MKTYNLLISHSWDYSDAYDRLLHLLRAVPDFDFKDYSIPLDDPIRGVRNANQLREDIKNHIAPCSVVLIIAGVYATYSEWMNIEIDLAQKGFANPKPIIAVRPRGSKRISAPVKKAANEIVRWNTDSIVDAIRELAI